MEISTSGSNVTIKGNIKSVTDYQHIKSTIDPLIANNKQLTINIVDSISMTSSVIGYLNKLVLKDKIDLTIKVGSQELYDLLDDLNLISIFKVTKVS